jgi:monoamine oxidase
MTDQAAFPASRRMFLQHLAGVGGTGLLMAGMSALGFGIEARAATPPVLSGGGGRTVVVLGSGVAGLTSAYELSKAGYEVTLLEARERVGGRSYTARKGTQLTELGGEPQTCTFDEGYYINPGPWRIPYHHRGYLHYAKTLGVQMELFNNDNDHSYLYFDKGSGPLAGKAVRKQAIAADTRGYASEILAKQINQGALDQQFTAGDKELLLDYLKGEGYLTAKDFKYVGTENRGPTLDRGAGLNPGEFSKPYPFTDILHSHYWAVLQSVSDYDQQRTMFEPVGGMDRLPYAFARELGPMIKLGHVVEKISQSPNKVEVAYVDKSGQRGVVVADYCVCAIPLSVLKSIDIQVSPTFKAAMSGVSYAPVGKIGLQMKRRFWEEDHAIYGGHIFFDNPDINSLSFPSTGWLGPKGVILGYYQFGGSAAKISALSLKQREAFAISQGAKVFPDYGDYLESSFSIAWHRVPYNLGGWAEWTEEGRKTAYPILNEPDGRIYLAGEHLSYITGWQEGGIESAWLQIAKLHKRVHA